MYKVVNKVVYKVVTRLFTRLLQGVYKVVTRLLQGCYHANCIPVTRLLDNLVATLLQGCYNLVFSVWAVAQAKLQTHELQAGGAYGLFTIHTNHKLPVYQP